MAEKWLLLSTRSKDRICGSVWECCKEAHDVEHRIFESESSLLDAVRHQHDGFSRVIVDANLRRMGRRVRELGEFQNLVIFDHDICQHYSRHSKWYRKYIPVIEAVGAKRVLVSSETLRLDLERRGVDAVRVLKGYDPDVVFDMHQERDIAAAFIGRTSNKVYKERRKMLFPLERKGVLELMKTSPGKGYNAALNRIRVFVSADIGFNEYMIKNYEAMAAGCALLAWRQPQEEQQAIGIEDGVNAMLYSSADELVQKLKRLVEDPVLRETIAERGQRLVVHHHSWRERGRELLRAIEKPLSRKSPKSGWKDLRILLNKL